MNARLHTFLHNWVFVVAAVALVLGTLAVMAATKGPPPTTATASGPSQPAVQVTAEEEQRLVAALQLIQQRQLELQTAQSNLNASQQFYRAEASEVLANYGRTVKTDGIEPREATENGKQTAHLWVAPLPATPPGYVRREPTPAPDGKTPVPEPPPAGN